MRAADIKRLIIKEQDVQRRLDQLVGIYLNLDSDYLEWLERWAIRQLLLEFEVTGSKELLSEAFRRGLSRVQVSKSPDDAKAISIAVFRAIEFFGGNLSKAELKHAKSVSGNLAGYLSLNK
ncbi:MAG: hypothetical protein L3J20_06240 [Flavobacteriaceae bacterium]|nr:hypothetical protein [Flavobacteriaceae bacterium]